MIDEPTEKDFSKLKITLEDQRDLDIVIGQKSVMKFLSESYSGSERQRAVSLYFNLCDMIFGQKSIELELDTLAKAVSCNSHKLRDLIRDFKEFGIIIADATRGVTGQWSGYRIALCNQKHNTIGSGRPLAQVGDVSSLNLKEEGEPKEKETKRDITPVSVTKSESSNFGHKEFEDKKQMVLNYWNGFKVVSHSKWSGAWDRHLRKRLNEMSMNELLQSIKNYCTIYKSDLTFFKHRWTLGEFLQRENGCPVFLVKNFEDYLADKKLLEVPGSHRLMDWCNGETRMYNNGQLIEVIKNGKA